jgi:hypothetical protein
LRSWIWPRVKREASSRSSTRRLRVETWRLRILVGVRVDSRALAASMSSSASWAEASGLRSSCDSMARNSSFWRLASASASSASFICEMSMTSTTNPASCPEGARCGLYETRT